MAVMLESHWVLCTRGLCNHDFPVHCIVSRHTNDNVVDDDDLKQWGILFGPLKLDCILMTFQLHLKLSHGIPCQLRMPRQLTDANCFCSNEAFDLVWIRPVRLTQMTCIGLTVHSQFHDWMQIQRRDLCTNG